MVRRTSAVAAALLASALIAAGPSALSMPTDPARIQLAQGVSVAEAKAYISENEDSVKREIKRYTEKTRIVNTSSPRRHVMLQGVSVESSSDQAVFVEVSYEFGSKTWSSNNARGTFLFEMQWDGSDLQIVGHEQR